MQLVASWHWTFYEVYQHIQALVNSTLIHLWWYGAGFVNHWLITLSVDCCPLKKNDSIKKFTRKFRLFALKKEINAYPIFQSTKTEDYYSCYNILLKEVQHIINQHSTNLCRGKFTCMHCRHYCCCCLCSCFSIFINFNLFWTCA